MIMEPVPFVDLRAQARALGPELTAVVNEVLNSGAYILGEPVERFERAFAAHCGVPHAVAISSAIAL